MPDLDGNGIDDRWEPHWIDDLHPDDKSALQTTFAGIDPETVVQHDMPSDIAAGLGLPQSTVEQAAATAPTTQAQADAPPQFGAPPQDTGWNPAFTQAPAPAPAPDLAFAQPGLGGVGARAIEKAVQSTEPGENLYADDPLNDPDKERGQQVLEGIALRDPVAFAKLEADHEFARQQKLAADLAHAAETDRLAAEGNLKNRRDAEAATAKKMAALDAQATELMSRKIDPDRYMSNRSVGRILLDMLGGAIGGYVATQTRGPNPYIAGMNQRIDADIDAQKQEIENGKVGLNTKRSILADEYARTGDLYQSAEAVRVATKTAIRDKILADQQLYDPKGTQFLARAKAAAEMTSAIAAGQSAHAQKEFDNRLKMGELQLKALAEKRQREKDAADLALKQAKLAGTGGGASGAIVPSRQMFAAAKHITGAWGQAEEAAYQQSIAKLGAGASTTSPGEPGPVKKYKTDDDWISDNRPLSGDQADRKRLWFVDKDHGNKVPPVEITAGVEPEKFIERQRKRRELSEKLDQLNILTQRLQKRGLWSKATSHISWKTDADAQEARALAEDITGDVIQEKGMGVPSGSDIERVETMKGGDPVGWKDPTPNLQRYRESLDQAQAADWATSTNVAEDDARYFPYRVLPRAKPEWVKKLEGRGEVKEIAPELPNADPKQLKPKSVAGDAPNVENAKAIEERDRNISLATDWLEDSGAVQSAEDDQAAAALGVGTSSRARPTPHVDDYHYKGAPEGSEAFETLRTQYVNSVANLNEYQRTHDPKLWKAFQTNQKEIADALSSLITTDDIPRSQRKNGDWRKDPSALAHLAGVVLRRGGKR